jgi:undecaprenyl-diphosphatase
MAVYGFVAYAIARDLDPARKRFELDFWALVVVALVGFSRIFLSVHYTSDVATGLLVGTFWLLVGFALSEHSRAVSALALRSDRT